MTAVLSANDALITVYCKADSCTSEAAWSAGPFKGLCELHAEPIRERMRASQRKLKSPPGEGSFAAKAKRLVLVGSKLDRAVAEFRRQQQRVEPAKQLLDEAMREWRAACRELGGEGS